MLRNALRQVRDRLPTSLAEWLVRRRSLIDHLPRQPLLPAELLKLAPVLVVAPHPDDETLGCGGLIALLRAHGQWVEVVFITDGEASHPNSQSYPPERLADVRRQEALAALRVLGVPAEAVRFLGLPDGKVPDFGDRGFASACASLCRTVELSGFQTVLVPWRRDPSPDHRASRMLALTALAARACSPRVLEYPIWALVEPGERPRAEEVRVLEVDIAAARQSKRTALAAHRSQLGQLIDDDPSGFTLTSTMLAHFDRPVEWLLEPVSSDALCGTGGR